MKKILSFVLVFAMLMSLCATAVAASPSNLIPTVDKTAVQAGENVVVTLSWDTAIENVAGFNVYLHYDGGLFSYNGVSTVTDVTTTTVSKKSQGTFPDNWVQIESVSLAAGFDVAAGTYATVTFAALENITEDQLASFTSEIYCLEASDPAVGEISDQFEDQSVSVAVAPAPKTTYTVSLDPAFQQTNLGGTAYVDVLVSARENATYAAADLKLTYDADKLAFNQESSIIPGTASVADVNGSLHVVIHGADKGLADTFKLAFDVNAAGEAKVVLNSANLDLADNAVAADAPAAGIGVDTAVIHVVPFHSVALGEDFTGEAQAADGRDYTFTAKDPHYDYTITATMGGESVDVTDNGDDSYTIRNITGELVISSTKAPKSYTVTVSGDGMADVTASDSAAYQTDYTFVLDKAEGYVYTVAVTIDKELYTPVLDIDEKTYTIAGTDVVGNIEIAVTKTVKPEAMTIITFSGEGSSDVAGGITQIAENGQDFSFALNREDGYEYTVKFGGEALTSNADGSYTIPGSAITGADLSVTLEKAAQSGIVVEVNEYLKLDGKHMWLVTAYGDVSGDKVLSYDGTVMFHSEKYGAYAWLVISEKSQEEVKAEAAAAIAEAAGTAVDIIYDNDINMTGVTDVNDAQLIWNMYNSKYDDFTTVSMEKFLRADAEGSRTVDVNDAAAVVNSIT